MSLHTPRTEIEAAALVASAFAERRPLEILGGGSRRFAGRPTQTSATISTGGLVGLTLLEPAEMVVGARAGTRVADLVAALEAKGQILPFEPPDLRAVLGTADAEPTVGGMVATNLSGPRRIMSGACRDSLIGLRFINGRGEAIASGGRVMKNVTGYDLVKLLAGSWGTLGLITEATFKVVPRPETSASLIWEGHDDQRAVALMSEALGSPFEVSAAAHVPARAGAPARTVLRLENFTGSVAYRLDQLTRELAAYGPPSRLDEALSVAFWKGIGAVEPLVGIEGALWRVSVAPSRAGAFLRATAAGRTAHLLDWGGGLIWLVGEASDGTADLVQSAARACGGHATLLRGPESLRATSSFMPPAGPAIAALTTRLRETFDPIGVLNPGRMGP